MVGVESVQSPRKVLLLKGRGGNSYPPDKDRLYYGWRPQCGASCKDLPEELTEGFFV
jgi:hypothetical protein